MRHHRLSAHAGSAFVLAAMFVVLPPLVAGGAFGRSVFDNSRLVDATRGAFLEFWASGTGSPPPALASAVDDWARYHALKALIAALLAIVLIAWWLRIRRAPGPAAGTGRGCRLARAAAGAGVGGLAGFAVLLVMANVQGVVAPLSSLLSLLSPDQRGTELATAVGQIQRELGVPGAPRSPALDTIVDDFARYHAALAVMAGAAAGLALFGAVRSRRGGRSFGLVPVAFAALLLVLCAANVSNALAPEHGLLTFYR